ncbi:hypothetical protein G6L37_00305 [Agrobacterium rubi]|nr:hypothetical protein [Agrobacterium rubi]NTF23830.1 hypothetical protein [Agrobacterium rubi]
MADAATIEARKKKMADNGAVMDKRWDRLHQDRAEALGKKIDGAVEVSRHVVDKA